MTTRQPLQARTGAAPTAGAPGAPRHGNEPGELVRAAGRGDQQAWETLVDRYSGLIAAVARSYRLSGADGADVAQTVWMRLVEHLPRLRDPERVGAWLATTARNECLRLLRNADRQLLVPDETTLEPPGDEESSPETYVLHAERTVAVRRAFSALSPHCQRFLSLLMGEEPLSYQDVGAALDMPIGSIGPTRGRYLERLRQQAQLAGV